MGPIGSTNNKFFFTTTTLVYINTLVFFIALFSSENSIYSDAIDVILIDSFCIGYSIYLETIEISFNGKMWGTFLSTYFHIK